ncbi:MAG: hypothetical protein PVI75_01990 [Gammaproteobacteria bacterium]|jgi:prophage antirepressor-like protein
MNKNNTAIETSTKIAVFKGKEIRKTIHNGEWWFSVIDIIEALTGSTRPRKYWSDLKNKLIKQGFTQVSDNIGHLKMETPNGKARTTDTAKMFKVLVKINKLYNYTKITHAFHINILYRNTFLNLNLG